jgi:hypothetical protein
VREEESGETYPHALEDDGGGATFDGRPRPASTSHLLKSANVIVFSREQSGGLTVDDHRMLARIDVEVSIWYKMVEDVDEMK